MMQSCALRLRESVVHTRSILGKTAVIFMQNYKIVSTKCCFLPLCCTPPTLSESHTMLIALRKPCYWPAICRISHCKNMGFASQKHGYCKALNII